LSGAFVTIDVFRLAVLGVAYFGLDFWRFSRFCEFSRRKCPHRVVIDRGCLAWKSLDFRGFALNLQSGACENHSKAPPKGGKPLAKLSALPDPSSSCYEAPSAVVFSADLRRLRNDFAKLKRHRAPS
jgi:hypothetical protein